MVARINDALNAYASAAGRGAAAGMAPRDGVGESFMSLVSTAAKDAVGSLHKSEQVSAAAAVGKADLNDVVTAVSNAEVTLQAAVAVRDKVIGAYQEILRMPI
jgi:flagellar hook-basal body complex protein FliE